MPLATASYWGGLRSVRPDYHVHLEHYGLGREALSHLVEAARQAGVSEIAVTEHAYHFIQCREIYPRDNPWFHSSTARHRFQWDLDTYVRLVESARSDGFPLKVAVEWDYFPGHETGLERLIRGYDWDLTLGAVHWLPRAGGWWGFDLPAHAGQWRERSVDAAYRDYFNVLTQAAGTGLFDVLAHPDVIKVFGYRPAADPGPLYEQIAAAAARSGACIEVNTAGWRKPVGELYPSTDFLAAFHRWNVPVVISSDAHVREHIGYGFDRAEAAVLNAGYTTRCVFTRRRREETPLPPAIPQSTRIG